MMKIKIYILIIINAIFIKQVLGQSSDFDLFQATETQNTSESKKVAPKRNSKTNTEPSFRLVGTSRFGESYIASLEHKSGEKVMMEWQPGIVKQVKGYSDYAIVDIKGRKLTLRLPDDEECISNTNKGISCNDDLAILSLHLLKPVEGKKINKEVETDSGITQNLPDEVFEIKEQPDLPPNPFSGEPQTRPELSPEEIAAREERRAKQAERFRNFEIVRIPDDEIPEGMRRIRSPFGDSLEPIED